MPFNPRSLLALVALLAVAAPVLAEDGGYSELPPADDGAKAIPTRSVGSTSGDARDDNVVVPEPGTLALLGAGLVTLGLVRRRRKG